METLSSTVKILKIAVIHLFNSPEKLKITIINLQISQVAKLLIASSVNEWLDQ